MFVKVATKIFEFVEIIHENITTDEILPSLSLVVTVIFILIGGYVMSYLGNFHKCYLIIFGHKQKFKQNFACNTKKV